jgi:hypothetical protein
LLKVPTQLYCLYFWLPLSLPLSLPLPLPLSLPLPYLKL